MKALVRKYSINAKKPEQSEVYTEPQWHDWIQADGRPLTDENLAYALCENCPEDLETYIDMENGYQNLADLFEVTEHTKTVPSEYGDGEEQTVKYWTAVFIGKPNNEVN